MEVRILPGVRSKKMRCQKHRGGVRRTMMKKVVAVR